MQTVLALRLLDPRGNTVSARLLDNGHIIVTGIGHGYTYGRLHRDGRIELYYQDGHLRPEVEAQSVM